MPHQKFEKMKPLTNVGFVPKSNYYTPSIFDEFLYDSEEGTFCSDITFLFNQQRLDKVISKDNFDSYFSKLLQDAGSNPYEGMSDDQILQFVKDRRMSSFNDWYNYTRGLIADSSDLEEYKNQLDERERERQQREAKFKSLFRTAKKSLDNTSDIE